MIKIISEFTLGDMYIRYISDENKNVGIILVPAGMEKRIVEDKNKIVEHNDENIDELVNDKNCTIEPLVQVKILGDDYPDGWSHGHTMRNGESVRKLNYDSQDVAEDKNSITILTVLKADSGHIAEHKLVWNKNYLSMELETTYKNNGSEDILLEMLSSFSLGGITPFEAGEAPNTLFVHRLRSKWTSEGRLETIPVADLQLEPAWLHHGVQCERFGQIGSGPVRKFFPFAAVEDIKNNVIWGVQLACASSWQIEFYRRCNGLSISGGIADYEFGHWLKKLKPGEKLQSPKAYISVAKGDIDNISQRLVSVQELKLSQRNNGEEELPVMFNEFCSTWGNPSHDKIMRMVEALKGKGIKYFVIDGGWYADKDKSWETNIGDWDVSGERFPEGLKKTITIIKEAGMVPGIWFELEICTRGAVAFRMKDHLLHRNGIIITTGDRRFWDMKDPWVVSYLSKKVIDFLKEYKFGYLKIDYNENIGIGCDGAESFGEELRQQILASQDFIMKIREEIPEIVIENCSSGGHRLEPSMMGIADIGLSSDAIILKELPIIAANLHRAILPRQSIVFATVRKDDTSQKLVYSLAGTFLGRMCISGDVSELNDGQWQLVDESIEFYKKIVPVIKNGFSYRYGPKVDSYRFPEGWQAVFRVTENIDKAIMVIHTFAGKLPEKIDIKLPIKLDLKVKSIFADRNVDVSIKDGIFTCPLSSNYQAIAVYME
jgi:alpha-galactosidase